MAKILIHPAMLSRPYEEVVEPLYKQALEIQKHWGTKRAIEWLEAQARIQMAEAERIENGG